MSEGNKSEKINHSTEEWFKIEVDRKTLKNNFMDVGYESSTNEKKRDKKSNK